MNLNGVFSSFATIAYFKKHSSSMFVQQMFLTDSHREFSFVSFIFSTQTVFQAKLSELKMKKKISFKKQIFMVWNSKVLHYNCF